MWLRFHSWFYVAWLDCEASKRESLSLRTKTTQKSFQIHKLMNKQFQTVLCELMEKLENQTTTESQSTAAIRHRQGALFVYHKRWIKHTNRHVIEHYASKISNCEYASTNMLFHQFITISIPFHWHLWAISELMLLWRSPVWKANISEHRTFHFVDRLYGWNSLKRANSHTKHIRHCTFFPLKFLCVITTCREKKESKCAAIQTVANDGKNQTSTNRKSESIQKQRYAFCLGN